MHELTEYYPFIIQNSEHFLQARRKCSSHVLPIINVPHFQPSFPRKKCTDFWRKKKERKYLHTHTWLYQCKLEAHELSCDRDANCTLTHSSLPISHRNARRKASSSSSSWSRRSRARAAQHNSPSTDLDLRWQNMPSQTIMPACRINY